MSIGQWLPVTKASLGALGRVPTGSELEAYSPTLRIAGAGADEYGMGRLPPTAPSLTPSCTAASRADLEMANSKCQSDAETTESQHERNNPGCNFECGSIALDVRRVWNPALQRCELSFSCDTLCVPWPSASCKVTREP